MSIMDIFKSAPVVAPTAPAAAPAPDGTLPVPTAPGVPIDPNAVNAAAPVESSIPAKDISPLDTYAKLWDTDDNKGEVPGTDPSEGITIDPAKIAETVSSIDFASTIAPNTQELLAAGGEGAQKAFVDALNAVSQQVFSQAMIANATLTKQAIANAAPTFDRRAEALLRHSQISDLNLEQNSKLNHPSVAPMIQAIETQLAGKFPQASAREISAMSRQYLEEFAKNVQGEPAPVATDTPAIGDVDWPKIMGMTPAT